MTQTLNRSRSGRFFSFPLFVQGLQKLRVPGIAMAISVIGLNTLFPLISAASDRSRAENAVSMRVDGWGVVDIPDVRVVDSFSEFAPLLLLVLAFAPLLAFLMFSYLNDRGKSDFYHAVPQTRLCVYFSFISAIATWITSVLLISTLLNLALWPLAIYHTVVVGEVFGLMLAILLGSLLTMAIAALAMTLTGTTVSNLFVAILILVVGRILFWECFDALESIAPAYDLEHSWTQLLAFDHYYPLALCEAVFSGIYYSKTIFNPAIILYTVALTLVLLALGAFCYHIRRSEMANRSAPNKYLQHVYRCAVTIPLLLYVIIDALIHGLDIEHIWIAAIALVLYLLYELTTTKKLKNLIRTLPVFGILIAACLLVYGGLYAVHAVVAADVPSTGRVSTVAVAPSHLRLDKDRIDINKLAIDDAEAIDLVVDALAFSAPLTLDEYREHVNTINNSAYDYNTDVKENISASYRKVSYTKIDVQLRLKSGRVMHRSVWIEEENWERLRTIYLSTQTYRDLYLALPKASEVTSISLATSYSYISLHGEESRALYAIVEREYDRLSDEQKVAAKEATDVGTNGNLPTLYLRSSGYNDTLTLSYEYFPESFAMVARYALEDRHGEGKKGIETLQSMLDLFTALREEDFVRPNDGTDKVGPNDVLWYTDFSLSLATAYSYDDYRDLLSASHSEFLIFVDTAGYSPKDPDMFSNLQRVTAILNTSDSLLNYEDTTRRPYMLRMTYSGLPDSLYGKTGEYGEFCGYVMLTPSEAAAIGVGAYK